MNTDLRTRDEETSVTLFRRIWSMYEHLYSALYEWNLKRWSGDDYMASFMTAAGLAGAVGMNIVPKLSDSRL
jgi:hypothetical protein